MTNANAIENAVLALAEMVEALTMKVDALTSTPVEPVATVGYSDASKANDAGLASKTDLTVMPTERPKREQPLQWTTARARSVAISRRNPEGTHTFRQVTESALKERGIGFSVSEHGQVLSPTAAAFSPEPGKRSNRNKTTIVGYGWIDRYDSRIVVSGGRKDGRKDGRKVDTATVKVATPESAATVSDALMAHYVDFLIADPDSARKSKIGRRPGVDKAIAWAKSDKGVAYLKSVA